MCEESLLYEHFQEREHITLAMDIAYEFKNLRSLVQFAY